MQHVVKPLINGRALALGAVSSAVFAILMFGLSYLLASDDFFRSQDYPGTLGQVFLVAAAVCFAMLAIWGTWGAWYFFRLERRRQAAARGMIAHTLLATEQPFPPAGPLALPEMIGIRAKWTLKLIAWPGIALNVIAVSASEAVDHGIWSVRFFLTLLAALATGGLFAHLLAGEMQIEVTGDQLTVRVAGIEERIVPWEQARLFAITRGRHATVSYELASSQASAPWVWVRPGTFSARLFEPTIPQEEYDHQMEALLALVAAKTRLPLYDLR
jgi:hypothetical protein